MLGDIADQATNLFLAFYFLCLFCFFYSYNFLPLILFVAFFLIFFSTRIFCRYCFFGFLFFMPFFIFSYF